jgi:hypothetical protein
VSQACPDPPSFQAEARAGTIAEAENQTDMPRNSARHNIANIFLFAIRPFL